jgi:primosomal protein N' (replication factor Y)
MLIAKVALLNTTREYDILFSYLIPDYLTTEVGRGTHVFVPFGRGNRQASGIVFEITDEFEGDIEKLKEISSIVPDMPNFPDEMIMLAAWMQKKYICTYSDAIKCILPSKTNIKTNRTVKLSIGDDEAKELIEGNKLRSINQIKVLQILLEQGETEVSEIINNSSVNIGSINGLSKKGLVEFGTIEIMRDPFSEKYYEETFSLEPIGEQLEIIDKIIERLEKHLYCKMLLHGVTGSGKTEVYMQTISKCISMGRNAILLVPEISLTPQMINSFKGRFGENVAVLHSRLSVGERYDQWRSIREGKVQIVIGARSAVFAPMDNIGIIIIDEEQEGTYKSESMPRYHAEQIAEYRCIYHGAVLLKGSATPSVVSYYDAVEGDTVLLTMNKRINLKAMPPVKIVSMIDEIKAGNRSSMSRELIDLLIKNKEAGKQSLLFLNRRGHSRTILCRDCGYTVKCPDCGIAMTYHSAGDRLICHYCGFTVRSISECPKCKSIYIGKFGTGTQKIEEELREMLPGFTFIRMDADTTSGKNAHEKILDKFRNEKIDIIIGTQMIAKGHDFADVTLVGILSVDGMLNIDAYNAFEKGFQLITQAAGRAGRSETQGNVIVQAFDTDNFCIQRACEHDYVGFYENEIEFRRAMRYPPFTHMGVVALASTNDRKVFDYAKAIKAVCSTFSDDGNIEVFGPSRPTIQKIKGKYRWRLVIKCDSEALLIELFTHIINGMRAKLKKDEIDMALDVDPVNFY